LQKIISKPITTTIITTIIMRDNVEVIVARYAENVAWVEELGYDFIVYDKGGDMVTKATPLPNIGREGHTYLTHIVRNYDRLATTCVFLQGDPFDHIDEHGKGDAGMLRKMIADVVERGVPFKGFAWFKLKCDHLGRPHDLHNPENEGRWAGWGRDIPVGDLFSKLFDAAPPAQIITRAPTGNFAVSGERIRTRPLDFYKYALQLIETDADDAHNTGHALERLWQYIFNGNTAWNKAEYK